LLRHTMVNSSPRLLTRFGERAFSHAGPAAWNSLPHELRAAPTLNCFKFRLSCLFSICKRRTINY